MTANTKQGLDWTLAIIIGASMAGVLFSWSSGKSTKVALRSGLHLFARIFLLIGMAVLIWSMVAPHPLRDSWLLSISAVALMLIGLITEVLNSDFEVKRQESANANDSDS
jgi:hypothetical protein